MGSKKELPRLQYTGQVRGKALESIPSFSGSVGFLIFVSSFKVCTAGLAGIVSFALLSEAAFLFLPKVKKDEDQQLDQLACVCLSQKENRIHLLG